MVEERLDIVINARDYATETLRGITGTVRSLGMNTLMLASNFATLTRELGIQSTFLNGIVKTMEILGVTIRSVGAAVQVYTAITRFAAAAEWAHSAALAFKIALIPIVGAAIVAGAMAMAASVKAMSSLSMQFGGVVPRSSITSTSYGPTSVNIYFENRAPISSEVDEERLLLDLGKVVAEKARRAGYH